MSLKYKITNLIIGILYILPTNLFSINTPLNPQFTIKKIEIIGNIKTSKNVIIRELTFKKGEITDSIHLQNKLQESKKNLLKTPLFNYVEIYFAKINNNDIMILVKLEERYMFMPHILLTYADRNFTQWLKRKDIKRINICFGTYIYNISGKNQTFYTSISLGYFQNYNFKFTNFSIDKKRNFFIDFKFNFKKKKEILYKTYNNKAIYIFNRNNFLLKNTNIELALKKRYKYNNYFFIKFLYSFNYANDTIIKFNPDFFINKKNKLNYSSINLSYLYDNLDSKIFPLEGYKNKIEIIRNGIFEKNKNINNYEFIAQLSFFRKLIKRFYFIQYLKTKFRTNNEYSYFYEKSLGYNDYIRGFEQNVIDGQHFILAKTQFRYQLIKPTIIKFEKIKNNKINKIHYAIYLNLFCDYAHVFQKNNIFEINKNNFVNENLFSLGFGLNFVTYYDKLIRLEAILNNYGKLTFNIDFKIPF